MHAQLLCRDIAERVVEASICIAARFEIPGASAPRIECAGHREIGTIELQHENLRRRMASYSSRIASAIANRYVSWLG